MERDSLRTLPFVFPSKFQMMMYFPVLSSERLQSLFHSAADSLAVIRERLCGLHAPPDATDLDKPLLASCWSVVHCIESSCIC